MKISGSTHMNRLFAPIAALAFISAGLSGCVSFGSEPPPSLLTLSADSEIVAGKTTTGAATSAVIVDMPEAARKIENLRLPVQVDDTSLAYLKDAVWVDRPARMFRSLLSETIAARSDRLVLDEVERSGQSDMRLSGTLVDFGYDARTKEAVVTFDAVRRTGSGEIEKRRFQAREDVYEAEAGPVGNAINVAANKVAVEIADWIG